MRRKFWHKPLHQRKIWKHMSLLSKITYYMQPFLEHFLDVWKQPLPFPTILKFMYSCVLVVFILLPIIYSIIVLLFYSASVQFILQRHFGLRFPDYMDLVGYAQRVITFEVPNQYNIFLMLYIERWRILGTAIASSIDYVRLLFCLLSAT